MVITLLCAILFAALNGYRWIPPEGDDTDGTETAEMVEATSMRTASLEDVASWIEDRLQAISRCVLEQASGLGTRRFRVSRPAKWDIRQGYHGRLWLPLGKERHLLARRA